MCCCSRSLSQRVAVYSKKMSSEGDSLAEEVRKPSTCSPCYDNLCDRHRTCCQYDVATPSALQVGGMCKRVDKALASATRHLDEADGWVDVVKELENARGIIFGNGAGGDL